MISKSAMTCLGTLLLALAASGSTAHAQTVEYIHTDALGSVVAITDEAGNVVERNEYEPYGFDLTGAKDGPGYTGHVTDAVSGLSYMQQRYYDPSIGRFLSVDPVTVDGNIGSNFNRYKYASNNPYRFTDPDGRMDRDTRKQLAVDRRSMNAHPTLRGSVRTIGGSATRSADATSNGGSKRSGAGGADGSDGLYLKGTEVKNEVEVVGAYGAGARYKRDLDTKKDELGLVLVGAGVRGRSTAAAGLLGLPPSADIFTGGYSWGNNDAPVDIEANFDSPIGGVNITFDPGGKIEAAVNFAPGFGSYMGVSVMFDDTLVED